MSMQDWEKTQEAENQRQRRNDPARPPETLIVRIEVGNDAFTDDPWAELVRIFKDLTAHFEQMSDFALTVGPVCPILDVNGNTVGEVRIEADPY